MSLRTDVHTAFDVITPATGGMAERVVETARREARAHRRRRFMVRMRAPISLVAVLIGIALIATAVIGTQAIRAWNAQHSLAPAGPPNAVIAQLEARPLNLPTLSGSDACPVHLGTNSLGLYGDGPVYTMEGDLGIVTAWGNYWTIEYFIAPSVQGPVLIRGKDIRSSNRVMFTGSHAAGATLGTDSLGGHSFGQRSEVVLDPTNPPEVVTGQLAGWKVEQGLFGAWTGCFGVQIDGAGFSETIIWGS